MKADEYIDRLSLPQQVRQLVECLDNGAQYLDHASKVLTRLRIAVDADLLNRGEINRVTRAIEKYNQDVEGFNF